jgi:pseudaminic acid cytidylyltransferase
MRTAIIPARGGSQRIKGKNIKIFAGAPMISWPILASLESGLFDRIYVSTDNKDIEQIALSLGAKVLWRPANLADSFSGTTEVIQNALETELNHLRDEHWVYKVYPTSPVTSDLVKDFVAFAEESPDSFSISVGKFRNNIERAMRFSDSGHLQALSPDHLRSRSQDLEDRFYDAGKIYGARVESWKAAKSSLLDGAKPFLMPVWASVDIDTEDDWILAELCFTHLRNSHRPDLKLD